MADFGEIPFVLKRRESPGDYFAGYLAALRRIRQYIDAEIECVERAKLVSEPPPPPQNEPIK